MHEPRNGEVRNGHIHTQINRHESERRTGGTDGLRRERTRLSYPVCANSPLWKRTGLSKCQHGPEQQRYALNKIRGHSVRRGSRVVYGDLSGGHSYSSVHAHTHASWNVLSIMKQINYWVACQAFKHLQITCVPLFENRHLSLNIQIILTNSSATTSCRVVVFWAPSPPQMLV